MLRKKYFKDWILIVNELGHTIAQTKSRTEADFIVAADIRPYPCLQIAPPNKKGYTIRHITKYP